MGGTVSVACLRLTKLTPVAALMRSCTPFFGVSGDLLWWRMEMAAVRMAGLAAMRWLCLGQLSTRRCNALLTLLRAPGPLCTSEFIIDLESVGQDHDNEDNTSAACGHATEWQGARHVSMANPP